MPVPSVYLGGACGTTTWRRDLAIPALIAAGVDYFDPQLQPGEWTEAFEQQEMAAKDRSAVLLWVITGETRAVASVAEAAYYIGTGRRFALAMVDVPRHALIAGRVVDAVECDDLNRGRIFVRTMARLHGVPVWTSVLDAVHHAIKLARPASLSLDEVRRVLAEVCCEGLAFSVTDGPGGIELRVCATAADADHGAPARQVGRAWRIDAQATPGDVARTAFAAAMAWQEHETRERFRYRGQRVFGPHLDVDALAALCRGTPPAPGHA